MRRVLCLCQVVLLSLLLSATLAPAAAEEVVVVYTARHYGQEPVFEAFTKQTGITMQSFDGNPAELFERLKAEGDKTSADVLIAVNAGDLWHAAQTGLSRANRCARVADEYSSPLARRAEPLVCSHRPGAHDHVQYQQGQT